MSISWQSLLIKRMSRHGYSYRKMYRVINCAKRILQVLSIYPSLYFCELEELVVTKVCISDGPAMRIPASSEDYADAWLFLERSGVISIEHDAEERGIVSLSNKVV